MKKTSILQLALPMIATNITIPLIGVVDTAVVGHLSHAYYLAAVGVGVMIFNFLFWGMGFLRMGITGLTAQAHGAKDSEKLRQLLLQSLTLALVLSLLMLLLQRPIAVIAFHFIHASPVIVHYAQAYFAARIWGAPAVLANMVLMGWFIGMQNTRIPLLQMTIVNLIAAILDVYFVFGLHWYADGVAWANVIAQYTGCVLGLLFVQRLMRKYPAQWPLKNIFNFNEIKHLLHVNKDIFIRTLALIVAFSFFTIQGARLGPVYLAANVVLMNFQTFMAYALDGFINAAEALIGRSIGAKDHSQFFQAVKTATKWSLSVAVVFVIVYSLVGKMLVNLLTDLQTVRTVAYDFLILVSFSPIISVWSYLFDGIFIGALKTRQMRNTMVMSLLIYFILWYFLRPLGNEGLWLAFLGFMLARGVTLGLKYYWLERAAGFIPKLVKDEVSLS